MQLKKYALIGAAGYVAPKHMKAIKDTGGELIAAYDPNDSVGIIDSYFPQAAFFTEFERFDRHLEKLKRNGVKIDYVVVCSPNYLHDAHIRFGLRYGADVICEKPIVLNPWNIDALQEMEKETGQKIYTILQLRLHKSIIDLKHQVDNSPENERYDLELTYIASRGAWYYASWKGSEEKSGGLATNIGIHFFDMLGWVFGDLKENIVHLQTHDRAAGILRFEQANIRWFLSINSDTLPAKLNKSGKRTYRSITLNGEELNFSEGFNELHTRSYEDILEGRGFPMIESKKAIETVYKIRHAEPVGKVGEYHPFCERELGKHPFKK